VPVQAVTEVDGKQVAYVVANGQIERHEVKVGDANEQLIQVLDGLSEGAAVALDARNRAAAELKQRAMEKGKDAPQTEKETSPTPPAEKAVAKS
jgi:hypothetical protein